MEVAELVAAHRAVCRQPLGRCRPEMPAFGRMERPHHLIRRRDVREQVGVACRLPVASPVERQPIGVTVVHRHLDVGKPLSGDLPDDVRSALAEQRASAVVRLAGQPEIDLWPEELGQLRLQHETPPQPPHTVPRHSGHGAAGLACEHHIPFARANRVEPVGLREQRHGHARAKVLVFLYVVVPRHRQEAMPCGNRKGKVSLFPAQNPSFAARRGNHPPCPCTRRWGQRRQLGRKSLFLV